MTARTPSTLTSELVRWGGLAALVGALLVLAGTITGTVLFAGEADLSEFADTGGYFTAVGLGLVGTLLLVFGVISLYAPQAEEAGAWGVAGFIGSMLGMVLFAASMWVQTTVVPSLAMEIPEFVDLVSEGEVSGPLSITIMIPVIAAGLGFLLFGIATFRAQVFSRRTAIVVIVGALVGAVPVPVSNAILLLAIAWMGYQVFADRLEPAESVSATARSEYTLDRRLETPGRP